MEKALVFFTTSWGRKHGGINVVNFELCKSLVVSDNFFDKIICMSLDKKKEFIDEGVFCYSLLDGEDRGKFYNADKFTALEILEKNKISPICFIGHDVKSGQIAIQSAKIYNEKNNEKVKSLVFHHMDYNAYDSFKDSNIEEQEKKRANQKEILNACDIVIPVGPKLYNSALDKTRDEKKLIEFIPGLPKIIGKEPKKSFSMITYGRFSNGINTVKQYKIPLISFAKLKKDELLENDSQIFIIGVNNKEEADELKEFVKKQSGNIPIPVNISRYNENQNIIYNEICDQNVSVLPSLHEGFGLTGWESIAAEVPLIISKNSGLFDFLKGLGVDTKGVIPIDIKGNSISKKGRYKKSGDVKQIYDAIKAVKNAEEYYNEKIKILKDYLNTNYNWGKVCEKFVLDLRGKGIELATIEDKIRLGEYYKHSFFLARNYMDIGDFISSKNLYLGDVSYKETTYEKQLNVIIIEQKYGLLKEAKEHYEVSTNLESFKSLDEKTKVLFELVNYKIESQLNNHDFVINNYQKIKDNLEKLKENERVFSVFNRAAVSFGVKFNMGMMEKCISYVENNFSIKENEHTHATSLMYKVILSFFRNTKLNVENHLNVIQKCQEMYFRSEINNSNIQLWQVHNFKSIIQCLFVESAIDYAQGNEHKWQLKMIAANLLTSKAMSSPKCEGYCSLISLIDDTKLKELISLAMYSDLYHRNEFQKQELLGNVSIYLRYLEKNIISIFNNANLDNWLKMKENISNYGSSRI
jgi:glycosyltransferase involved in cell wall biosynthesis